MHVRDERVPVDRDTKLTLFVHGGATYVMRPAEMSFGERDLKLGASSDPGAPIVAYRDIDKIWVRKFSLASTIWLGVGVAAAATLLGFVVLACSDADGC